MASRLISDLHPKMQPPARDFQAAAAHSGHDFLIYCTRRSLEEQAFLWRAGRHRETIRKMIERLRLAGKGQTAQLIEDAPTHFGRIILTKALPGESAHNYGYAFDAVPLAGGKALWRDAAALKRMGEVGEEIGLEWAGRWTRFKEMVHFQLPQWRDFI